MAEKLGSEQVKENLKNKHHWFRLIWILICVMLFMISTLLALAVVIASIVALLITGERQENLSRFGGQLAIYLKQLTDYATLNRDQMPFPLDDWPVLDDKGGSSPPTAKSSGRSTKTASKTTASKSSGTASKSSKSTTRKKPPASKAKSAQQGAS